MNVSRDCGAEASEMLRLLLCSVGAIMLFLGTTFVIVFFFGINMFIVNMADFPGGKLTISENEYEIDAGDHIRLYIVPISSFSPQIKLTCGNETDDGNTYIMPESDILVFVRTRQCSIKSFKRIIDMIGPYPYISAMEKCASAIERLAGYDLPLATVSEANVSGDADRGKVTMPFSEAGQQRTAVCVFDRDKPTRVTLDGKLLSGR